MTGMSNRDEFSPTVKRKLAERAGYRCSFPDCSGPTIGPSDESTASTSNVGMACHIAGASDGPGSRRYVPSMTVQERSSIENGIWMCYTHGKLIDTDETRFTIEKLKHWRRISELRAKLALEHGGNEDVMKSELSHLTLADSSITISSRGSENMVIGNALRDSCVPLLWGKSVGHAIRDFAIELARNAFEHGSASKFSMHIEKRTIRLSDDGNAFDPRSMPSHQMASGGADAVRSLLENFAERLIVASRRSGSENETVISLVSSMADIANITPCYIELTYGGMLDRTLDIDVLKTCNVIYVTVPDFFTFSDVYEMAINLSKALNDERPITFVVTDISDKVKQVLLEKFSNSRVITVPQR